MVVQVRANSSRWRGLWGGNGRSGTRAQIGFVTNSRLMHRAAARNGMGRACLTRYISDDDPLLVRLAGPPGSAPPVRELSLGVHDDMRHMPRIRAFTDAVQAGLRQAAGRLRPLD